MAVLRPLARALGKLRQLTSGDTLRLPGPLDLATPVDYAPALSGGVLNWDLLASNTGFATNTATISSMTGATDGAYRVLKFAAGASLVHTANVLELPGAATITTALGDSGIFLRRSSTRWQCVMYQRADGTALVGGAYLPLAGGRMTGAINFAGYAFITAAQSMNIEGANANTVRVDYAGGALNITVFGSGTFGTRRILYFNNSQPFTLVHSTGNMILPGNENIVPAVGDFAEFQCEGGGTWRCMWYQRRSGQSLVASPDATKLPLAGGRMTGAIDYAGYVALAAANGMNLEGANSNTIRVDYAGAAMNINAFGSGTSGTRRILFFNNTAPFTLLHDSSLTILPGNANIIPERGDHAEFACEGGATWRCMWYQRRSGLPLVSAGGSMTTYTWDQASALAVWTIPHNLGRFPSVTVVDGLGVKVEPDVTYTDANTVTVTHSAALAGKAYLN